MTAAKKLGPFDADPNLVPFRSEWKDNTGSMANAIFWLDKNWNKQLNAQGQYTDQHGRVVFWNYGWLTKTLLVHVNGSREHWRIDCEKMLHMEDGVEEMATIYRPFFEAQCYGMNTHETNGVPIVEWLKTREVMVIKNHHDNRIPLYAISALRNLEHRLNECPLNQFSQCKLGGVLIPQRLIDKTAIMTHEQAKAYVEVIKQLNVLKRIDHRFEEHHIHSYTALVKMLNEFLMSLLPQVAAMVRIKNAFNDEMNRLCKEGHPKDAAILDALNFDRTWAESYEKTLDIAKANCPHLKEAN